MSAFHGALLGMQLAELNKGTDRQGGLQSGQGAGIYSRGTWRRVEMVTRKGFSRASRVPLRLGAAVPTEAEQHRAGREKLRELPSRAQHL